MVAGNFNLTNVDDLFGLLVNIGQHPVEKSDTVTIMEKIGHFLDLATEDLAHKYRAAGSYTPTEIQEFIDRDLDLQPILQRAAVDWDGGYAMAGIVGSGDAFVLRDPSGIRPAYCYQNDEILVVCSERAAIRAAFHVPEEIIEEITPGNAIIVKKNGKIRHCLIRASAPRTSCSFERIYFSRGSDGEIYNERKLLGRNLIPQVACSASLGRRGMPISPHDGAATTTGLPKGSHGNKGSPGVWRRHTVGIRGCTEAAGKTFWGQSRSTGLPEGAMGGAWGGKWRP